MRIVWYDITFKNFQIYYPALIEHLRRDCDLILLAEENDSVSGVELRRCGFKTAHVTRLNGIISWLGKLQPDMVLTHAQRIPDMLVYAYCRKHSIRTIMFQHGMYNGFLRRDRMLFINKLSKTVKYFKYSIAISKIIGNLAALPSLLQIFIVGNKKLSDFDWKIHVLADQVLIYGEYWRAYHTEEFGYSRDVQHIIGYNRLTDTKVNPVEVRYQYIAQTLVEDGRMGENEFKTMLDDMLKAYGELHVKLHPRSNRKLYKVSGKLYLTDDLLEAEYYIGHYSSVLGLLMKLQKKVIIWGINEHEIPSYFLANASEVIPRIDELSEVAIDEVFANYLGDENVIKSYLK